MRWLLAAVFALAPATGMAKGCDRPVPIRFSPGASQGSAEGVVVRGGRDCFVVTGRAGQTMRVEVHVPEENVVFQLYAPGWRIARAASGVRALGDSLPGAAEGQDARSWEGQLKASGPHLIMLGGTQGNAAYYLTVSIR